MTSAFTAALLTTLFTPPPMPTVAPPRLQAPDIVTVSISGFSRKTPDLLAGVSGDHLVHNNGELYLGPVGSVPVEGLTLEEAEQAISKRLKSLLPKRQAAMLVVSLQLKDSNKHYYRIQRQADGSDEVERVKLFGNVCILDALADQLKNPELRVTLVRRRNDKDQILPIFWKELTQQGVTRTNYQLLPGDFLYVNVPVSRQ